jgi:hypothetical protein
MAIFVGLGAGAPNWDWTGKWSFIRCWVDGCESPASFMEWDFTQTGDKVIGKGMGSITMAEFQEIFLRRSHDMAERYSGRLGNELNWIANSSLFLFQLMVEAA